MEDDVIRMIGNSAKRMDIDIDANANDLYEDSEDEFMDSDIYMEMILELSDAYIQGMEMSWPHGIIS